MAISQQFQQKRATYDEQLLSFPDAMQAIIDGYRVTRRLWENSNVYGDLMNDQLMIHLEDGYHPWLVSTGDMFAEDWMTLD